MQRTTAINPWASALLRRDGRNRNVLFLCLAGAVLVASLVALAGPLLALVVAAALPLAVVMLLDVRYFFWGALAVITLLPFATLPVDIGVTPTFLEVMLAGAIALVLVRGIHTSRVRLDVSPVGVWLLLFLGLMVASFVMGIAHARPSVTSIRRFADLLLALGFFFIALNVLEGRLVRQTYKVLVALGAAAAFIGITLYFLPNWLSESILNKLALLGYPGGSVLRYVEDNPALALRAIGTSVDPNVFGGLLAIMGGLSIPRLFAPGTRRQLLSRAVPAGLIGIALLLTYSRGSMFGLAAALSLLALVRHRKLLWVLAAGALLVLVLPMTRDYVQHFVEGLRGQDLATQMRFGEYKDALLLISRYPWFGVGFTGVPDVDIYLGVSNLYLLIAEEMGLVGVSVFLLTMLTYFLHVWPASRLIRGVDSELESMLLGTLTAVAAGLVAGVLDHYLFNLTFPHAATLLWLVVALGVAAAREARQDSETGAAPVVAAVAGRQA